MIIHGKERGVNKKTPPFAMSMLTKHMWTI